LFKREFHTLWFGLLILEASGNASFFFLQLAARRALPASRAVDRVSRPPGVTIFNVPLFCWRATLVAKPSCQSSSVQNVDPSSGVLGRPFFRTWAVLVGFPPGGSLFHLGLPILGSYRALPLACDLFCWKPLFPPSRCLMKVHGGVVLGVVSSFCKHVLH